MLNRIFRLLQRSLLVAVLPGFGLSYAQQVELSGLPDYPSQPVSEATWTRTAENMRWMSRNFSVKPSLILSRGEKLYEIPANFPGGPGLGDFEFIVPGNNLPLTLREVLEQAEVDAFLVLKADELIYEQYFNGFDAHTHHSWFSGAKSLLGMAVGILVEEGRLDVGKSPADYISELRESAYAGVTLQQVLNMTTALAYTSDPEAMNPGHLRHEYLKRGGMLPAFDIYLQTLEPSEENVPRGVRAVSTLVTASTSVDPGKSFDYQNINVDVLGWVIERASGQPLSEFLRDRVWRKLQTEHDAIMPTDPNYTALAAGGLSSTARDAARFGLSVVNGGLLGKAKIFPQAWIESTCRYNQADEQSFFDRRKTAADFSAFGSVQAYRNYWYIHDRGECAMATRGFGGQSIYINRARGVVIVTFASALAEDREGNNALMYVTHQLASRISSIAAD